MVPSMRDWRSVLLAWWGSCSARSKCICRLDLSCSACADSAAKICATQRKAPACSSVSPDSASDCSRASTDSADLRARMKRPSMNWAMPSSKAACAERSFCSKRQRLACLGNSNKAVKALCAQCKVSKMMNKPNKRNKSNRKTKNSY